MIGAIIPKGARFVLEVKVSTLLTGISDIELSKVLRVNLVIDNRPAAGFKGAGPTMFRLSHITPDFCSICGLMNKIFFEV